MYALPLFNEATGCVVFYIVRDEGLCESGRGQSSHGGPKEQHRDEWNAHYVGCECASFSHHFLSLFSIKRCRPTKGARPSVTENLACVVLDVHLEPFLAELREAVCAAACELCATVTSNHLSNVQQSPQSRRVGILGYRARQILSGSLPVTARCSAQD